MQLGELDLRFSSEDASPVAWNDASEQLAKAEVYWLSTVRPDGRPHVTPLLAIWRDEAMYFCTGPSERKARNLEQNQHCVITTGCDALGEGYDVVVEGAAAPITDDAKLQDLADAYESKYGKDWHFESKTAPSTLRAVRHSFSKWHRRKCWVSAAASHIARPVGVSDGLSHCFRADGDNPCLPWIARACAVVRNHHERKRIPGPQVGEGRRIYRDRIAESQLADDPADTECGCASRALGNHVLRVGRVTGGLDDSHLLRHRVYAYRIAAQLPLHAGTGSGCPGFNSAKG